ncbi:MgPa-like protein, DHH family phosphoesterase [Mycoplasma haemocanis str. Illinois]|uniref:MgPa-like protein, DHH family phosphoesterase n=1 Tax=Mycoplasma haemocanis (strain Illinois) TaxID=1111676 RepID=H6N5U0_MYCHN|nr:bifunctional oligoribonuclease/PAP phosphatase NrnA [Mycoplasma haemocanis]AEW45050.1 MgPa-like protein, DHH family phosphoesterase [Mycoplasma haemocanis str. Illinois]
MLNRFITNLLSKLEEYDNIAIFVHVNPDFDAYASAFSLKRWIIDNFPESNVNLMIPEETFKEEEKFLFYVNEVLPSKYELKNYLGIILDTSDTERVLTQLHTYCAELAIIDHHPKIKGLAQMEFIDPTYPAVSQILAEIFIYLEESGGHVFNADLAQYLYAGIITDTNNFMSLSMLPSTYNVLANLVSRGLNRNVIHNSIFVKSFNFKVFTAEVIRRTHLTKNGLAYAVIDKKIIDKCKAWDFPHTAPILENISNVEVWTTLTYDAFSGLWKCSIRSKELIINHVAKLYGGGGHKTMSAISFKKKKDFFQMLATMDEYMVNSGYSNATEKDFKFSLRLFFHKTFNLYKKI